MADPATTLPTYADYLAMENASPEKHEWIAGEIRAMAGASAAHARLCAQMTTILGQRLRGKPCQPYSSDLRVRAEVVDVSTYPDISVVCGEPERASDDKYGFVNPTLLVEVSSPSTESYDRGEKFDYYRTL
ncbi:MAG: Uma2 family endonuclease, partial [Deltaproteobacteria bacterium]|nr:Uma2 family endonuclease [Deltaproteobacteria bacterium]